MMSTRIERLKKICNQQGIISALAIDQRGALKRMLGDDITPQQISEFKTLVSQILTPYASSILLDPEFGWSAAAARDSESGLMMAYEKTGYDKTTVGRFPDLIDDVSVLRLKEKGADAVKLLLYVDVDEPDCINDRKKAFVERIASECKAEEMPLFLEILTYDANTEDEKEYAKLKPRKVIEAMRSYADPKYGVDVFKVEVPVNMKYVEGYAKDEVLYSQAEAAAYFAEQSAVSPLPFIFLSAGVSAELFQQTLVFAKQAGSHYNGVLCGRATWADGAKIYKAQGKAASIEWLKTQGMQNIQELDEVLQQNATPISF
nr:tagatose 1,6-diphosphate aldolase [Testudinibacter sp. TR-2022]